MLKHYVENILASLERQEEELKHQWLRATPVRYFVVDDLLPSDEVNAINAAFPPIEDMRLMRSLRECKYTSKDMASFDPKIRDVSFAFQDPAVIKLISEITGIVNNGGDPSFYAGGISSMEYGQFLNPHIDNSHDGNRERYRTLNLLFYTTPDWNEEYGGNLELWDNDVRSRITITSKANRLVVMETNSQSWHSVNPLKVKLRRNCVSNYYFSTDTPEVHEYFNVTKFSARPEQKVRRRIMILDAFIRNSIRRLVPAGLGKKDINST